MMIGNDLQPNDGLLPPQREYQIHILTTVLSIAMTSRVCTDFSKPQPQFKGDFLNDKNELVQIISYAA